MTEQILLEVQKVSRSFGKFQALSNVSLKIQPSQLCALIGPNGAGKTTFYNVISGRYRSTSGRVFFEGRDITRAPAHRLVGMGLLRSFQITNIFPALTVLENVLVPLVVHHGNSFSCLGAIEKRQDLAEEAEQILSRVGLTGQSHRVVSTLAYGDKRLIEIAIVLARRPRLVLLDEPTLHLDLGAQVELLQQLRALARSHGYTIVVVTHELNLAAEFADQVALLHRGKCLRSGTPADVYQRELLEQVFGASLEVETRPSGRPHVSLLGRREDFHV